MNISRRFFLNISFVYFINMNWRLDKFFIYNWALRNHYLILSWNIHCKHFILGSLLLKYVAWRIIFILPNTLFRECRFTFRGTQRCVPICRWFCWRGLSMKRLVCIHHISLSWFLLIYSIRYNLLWIFHSGYILLLGLVANSMILINLIWEFTINVSYLSKKQNT